MPNELGAPRLRQRQVGHFPAALGVWQVCHVKMVVPETGIEPVRPFGREILSLLCLPISPFGRFDIHVEKRIRPPIQTEASIQQAGCSTA